MHIDYATSLRPVSAWSHQTMAPIVREAGKENAYRGYLRAGYGNNGNVDARLGYLWDISKKDRLSLAASFDGWNGDLNRWSWDEHCFSDEKWTSRMYNTKVGLDYKHAFKKVDFKLGGDYHSRVFNYMIPRYFNGDEDPSFDGYFNKQHQTFANAYIGFASTDKDMPVQFEAQAGIRYFDEKYPTRDYFGEITSTETNLFVMGNVWKNLNEENSLGLDFNFDTYNQATDWADEVMAIEFNPYYAKQNDTWKVRVGAHLDWIGRDVSYSEDNYDKFYVSPDVNVEYIFSDSYVLYAKAGGGRGISSLYELMTIAPYLVEHSVAPTYMTLDAALGLKASPADGWWFNVSGGYQIRENDVCMSIVGSSVFDMQNKVGDTKVFYATAELKHDYKDLFDFSLKGTYYNWKWDGDTPPGGSFSSQEAYALSLKPELEVNAEVGFKPMQGLRVNVGYDYVKRCNEDCGDPVSNLYAGADYALMKNLSVFAQFNNLLNKEYVTISSFPAQKLNFMAGVSLQF
jgi:outer membrane receptor protein involved in Fe transport